MTFNFQDVPVRTVLQLIAEESNLNIVASDTVQGNVTLRLINVPWDQALDIVLQAKGLDKRRSGNVVWIAPQAELAKYEQDKEDARIAIENRVDLVTEYIQINYHNAEEIAKLLTEEARAAAAAVAVAGGARQQRQRFPVVARPHRFDRAHQHADGQRHPEEDRADEGADQRDRPAGRPGADRGRIVIATESLRARTGRQVRHQRRHGQRVTSAATSTPISATQELGIVRRSRRRDTARRAADRTRCRSNDHPRPDDQPAGVANPAGSLALSILNAGYLLDVELSAMQTEGRGEVISNPRIVTSNQREAVISQGQEVGYVTIDRRRPAAAPIPSVQFKEVLLEMKVTPTITNDGRVFLNMNVKKDEVEASSTPASARCRRSTSARSTPPCWSRTARPS